jgi:hypothetical protein
VAERKLVVSIVGDDTSLQKTLNKSIASLNKFGKEAAKATRPSQVSVAPQMQGLLDDVRKMQSRNTDLAKREADAVELASKRSTAGLGRMAATAGIASLAITATYQASQQLQQALRVTGEEAFTTSGKIRNFSAALLNMDIVGGVQALTAAPKTLEDLGFSFTELKNRMSALQVVAGDVAPSIAPISPAAAGAGDDLRDFGKAADEAGTSSSKLAREAINLVQSILAAEQAQSALADSVSRLGTAFRTAAGDAVFFKGAVDDAAGPRGPGGVDAINVALEAARGPTSGRLAREIGPTARNANAQILAQANQELDALLKLQQAEFVRLTRAVANSTGNRQQRIALNRELALAEAAVIGTQRQIKENADAARKAAAAAEKAARAEAEATRKADAAAAKARREAQQAIEQARQFRAIGLSPEGNKPTPTIGNLQKQLRSLLGRDDLTKAARGQLKNIGKVLSDPIRKATDETRAAIRDLFDTIRSEFDKGGKQGGPLTKTTGLNTKKILEGLGLTPEAERELRQRLSGFNSAGIANAGNRPTGGGFVGGQQPVVVNTTVVLDGEKVGRSTTRHQQKDKRRNPKAKRGPRSGL